MKRLSNDHEDRPNQHKNCHKLCDETGRSVVNLMDIQLKLRQEHDQNCTMEEKKEIKPNEQDCEN